MNSFLKILSWFAIAAGIVLVVVGITFLFIPKYQRMCGLESRCRHLREQVENKQHEIQSIRVKQGRLLNSSPASPTKTAAYSPANLSSSPKTSKPA